MPVWGWILIAVAVVLIGVAVGAAAAGSRRKRTERLKDHFGPEYERTVSLTGEPKAAEKELAERERQRKKLDIHPLTAASLNGYVTRWRAVQTAFVDHPASAVGEADILVTEVMRERGYPVDDDFEQEAANISVDHPMVVNNYRAAHDIYLSQQQGDVGTEAQRQAFVHYRALFEKLLENDTNKSQEATA
jgi:transposase InsO family protein